jgi:hypothetical protein
LAVPLYVLPTAGFLFFCLESFDRRQDPKRQKTYDTEPVTNKEKNMSKITIEHDDIRISIKGDSEHFFCQDLYTRAVMLLINEADVHGWQKHNIEHGLSSESLFDFSVAVLVALTRLWMDDGVPPLGDISKPVHEILNEMIGDLRKNGYLEVSYLS